MLAPVAVAVAAWSANLGSADEADLSTASPDPGIPTVPATAYDDPANYTKPPSLDPRGYVTDPNHDTTDPAGTAADAASESANGIPTAAVMAYQRTEAVLAQADPACHLPWALVAAIGRVESDHGRFADNVLGDDGKSRPGIYGPALDGRSGTALVADTDAGAYDKDRVYDRAVGPMQFIPSTWEIVGVDADADDIRDPQDIDDAALAAGVYLCAGNNDLSTVAGQQASVFSYNHSEDYVNLVLAIMRAYETGNFVAVANGQPSNDDLTLNPTETRHKPKPGTNKPGGGDQQGGNDSSTGNNGTERPGTGGGGNDPKPSGGSKPPTEQPGPSSPLGPVGGTVTETVDPVIIATNKCTQALAAADIPATQARLQQCIAAYQEGGMSAVNHLIDGLLDTLGGVIGGLGGGDAGGTDAGLLGGGG